MGSEAGTDALIVFEETLYNTNLILDVLLVLFSVPACWVVFKHARETYTRLSAEKKKHYSYETRQEIYNLRTVYVRDVFLFLISLDEAGQKSLNIIDYILLQVRDSPYAINPNLTDTCTINPVSSLGFYYHRGPGYYFLFALINTFDIFLLVLLNSLTLFLIKSYSEHPRWRSLYIYIITSILFAALTLILTPIQYTLIPGNLLYAKIVLTHFVLLCLYTRRLYLVLRQRKREVVSQRMGDEIIKQHHVILISYKYFSVAFLIVLVIYLSGQWLEIFVVTLIGSLLENSCWFGVVFGTYFSFPYNAAVFQPFKLISIYSQFVTTLIMNFVLCLIYLLYIGYTIYYECKQSRTPHIHYTTMKSESLQLETSLIQT